MGKLSNQTNAAHFHLPPPLDLTGGSPVGMSGPTKGDIETVSKDYEVVPRKSKDVTDQVVFWGFFFLQKKTGTLEKNRWVVK